MAPNSSRRLMAMCHVFIYVSLLAGAGEGQTFFTRVPKEVSGIPFVFPRSTAFGDFNNDGWPDVFLATSSLVSTRIALLQNTGDGKFKDQTDLIRSEVPSELKGGGAIFGDYDNDGDLDLFIPIGTFVQNHMNMLLRNDRGIFTDVALETGLIHALPTDNAIWLDYDRDGNLDLYTGNVDCSPPETFPGNILYHNLGDGRFVDATEEAGLDVMLQGDCGGGSSGGMVSGDFNGDGWGDLYMGVYLAPNRLFLNDGKGGFSDATSHEIADPGQANGMAVGDINNDGALDFFQSSGIFDVYRSAMFLNLGGGEFLDVTEGIGLSRLLKTGVLGPALGDIDNDGDLDLIIGNPHRLFLNEGSGSFVDRTPDSGIGTSMEALSLGDYDLNGYLDVIGGTIRDSQGLYRNNGNENHWLRVDLVGIESNRNGIGARLVAISGDLVQTREILGGLGFYQDEMVGHFGLGQRTRIDQLEIRWPSGHVDVVTDIPADQKIRVIEGQETYHVVHPATWQHNAPDAVVTGDALEWDATVRPALFEKDAKIVRVVADLSAWGGPPNVPFTPMDDGTYQLDSATLIVEGITGSKMISVMIDQETSVGSYWTHLSAAISLIPDTDQIILSDGISEGWQVNNQRGAKSLYFTDIGPVDSGAKVAAFQVQPESMQRDWRVDFLADPPVRLFGYTSLSLSFHPGDAVLPESGRFSLFLKGDRIDLLGQTLEDVEVDMDVKEWQKVEIPLIGFDTEDMLNDFRLLGNFSGTFYLDDIRLVAATPPSSTTDVTEAHIVSLPQTLTLDPNYPNPFNSATVIGFALPAAADVDLAIFNLAGQRVATLAEGVRETGTYTVHWDGRDGDGRELASGVYLYRLQTGDGQQVVTRKLVLVR